MAKYTEYSKQDLQHIIQNIVNRAIENRDNPAYVRQNIQVILEIPVKELHQIECFNKYWIDTINSNQLFD